MAAIRLEFAQFGHFDSFDVIRSTTSIAGVADVDLPTPIATGLKTMYYVDASVIKGSVYYYKVRVWRGGVDFVSSEIEVYAFDNSLFVLRSNFLTDMVDKTGKSWSPSGNIKISGGALLFDGAGDYLMLPGTDDLHFIEGEDVTIRFKVKLAAFNSANISTIFSTWNPNASNGYGIRLLPNGLQLVMWNILFYPTFSYTLPLNTEIEISLERKDMQWRLYVDGVQADSAYTQPANYARTLSSYFYLGSGVYEAYGSTRDLNGSIRYFQVIKGLAIGDGGATTKRI